LCDVDRFEAFSQALWACADGNLVSPQIVAMTGSKLPPFGSVSLPVNLESTGDNRHSAIFGTATFFIR